MSYFAGAADDAHNLPYPPRLRAAPAARPAPAEVLKNLFFSLQIVEF